MLCLTFLASRCDMCGCGCVLGEGLFWGGQESTAVPEEDHGQPKGPLPLSVSTLLLPSASLKQLLPGRFLHCLPVIFSACLLGVIYKDSFNLFQASVAHNLTLYLAGP